MEAAQPASGDRAPARCPSAWRPLLLGGGALFPFAGHLDLPWWGLFPCVGVGIVAGLQSGLLTGLLYKAEDLFGKLPIHWMWWPAIGGLVVGLGGYRAARARRRL